MSEATSPLRELNCLRSIARA